MRQDYPRKEHNTYFFQYYFGAGIFFLVGSVFKIRRDPSLRSGHVAGNWSLGNVACRWARRLDGFRHAWEWIPSGPMA